MISEVDIKDMSTSDLVTTKIEQVGSGLYNVTLESRNIKGTKHDQAKPMMNLLDREALEGLAKVLTFGAKKYSAENWRKGLEYSRTTAALMRHLLAFNSGEDLDPESGLPHIDHLGCCWMFLSNATKTRPDLDDRHGRVKEQACK